MKLCHIAAATLAIGSSTAIAQTPGEILGGAEELNNRLEEARSANDAKKTCAMIPVIEAEKLAVQRLMTFRLERTLDSIEDGVDHGRLNEAGEELGRYIGVTNVLSRMLGRAEIACSYLSKEVKE